VSPVQLELRAQSTDALWQELRRLLREVVAHVGVKETAFALDVAPSSLLHALDERERHHVRAEWLPFLITKAPNDDVVAYLAGLRGLDLAPRRLLTDGERLERLEDTLARTLGPDILRALYEKAYGKGRP
jgi:hypothetical protein